MIYKLLDPGILYVVTWLFATSLYLLRYSLLLLPMTVTAYSFFLGSCAAFILPSIIGSQGIGKSLIKSKLKNDSNKQLDIQSNTEGILYFWLVLSLVETIIAKNLPLLGVIGIGPAVRYTDFGIPSLHGLLNSCVLVLSNYAFQRYLSLKDNKYIREWFLYLIWSIALLGRQLMLSQLIQTFFIFIAYQQNITHHTNIINISNNLIERVFKITKYLFFGWIFITLFGSIGDSRNASDSNILEVAQSSPSFPKFLPSAVFWIYLYITSPLSNVIHNIGDGIDSIKPSYIPMGTLAGIIPSQLRSVVTGQSDSTDDWRLVEDFLNVSSFHQPFLADFGVLGSLFVYFLLSFLVQRIYKKSKLSNLACWRFSNIVILHNIVFSVFINFFTNLVFLGQIAIHISLQYQKIKSQRQKV